MSTATVERLSLSPGTAHAENRPDVTLEGAMEELVRLRFSIILTARWETAEKEDAERRSELRIELAELRRCYFDRIDAIAMTFGVQKAMDAKEQVERHVVAPANADRLEAGAENGLYF